MNNSFINNPLSNLPSLNSYSMPTSNQTNIAKVNGLESVKACATVPQSKMVYFDANEDIFYIKETDINNYPTIRSYKFEEIKPKENLKTVEYVTIDEFNKFKEELLNGKQYIWDDSGANSAPRRYAASATNTEHNSAGS